MSGVRTLSVSSRLLGDEDEDDDDDDDDVNVGKNMVKLGR